jgi:PiT family inorganic phosphate transporter
MDIASFFPLANAYPWAYVAILLTWGVTFVNGWTDGPNSIATCVTTRAMRPKPAVIMCAILNGLGTLAIGAFASFISSLAGGDVSKTIAQLVNWGDSGVNQILCAISCGMAAIIIVS